MNSQALKIECLALTQAFETLWAYYTQSGGQLYGKECREMAIQFINSYEELLKLDKRVGDPKELSIGENSDVADIVRHLKEWGENTSTHPYEGMFKSRFMLFAFMTGLKSLLLRDSKISRWPTMILSSMEQEHTAQVIRWRGHMP